MDESLFWEDAFLSGGSDHRPGAETSEWPRCLAVPA